MNTLKKQSVPELRPSVSDFAHPIKYLSQPAIVELGEKFGILKVIPPEGWDPKFALDWNTFKFHTRIQILPELNLRNRSRASFVEGFNFFLQSKGFDPIPVTDNLCLGVADEYPITCADLENHLNGWILLKDNSKVHIHDIFVSKEYRRWFYRIRDGESDNELLKNLSAYCKFLLKVLKLDAGKTENDPSNHVVPTGVSHTTLQKLLKNPAALLAQPENIAQLQRMKSRISKTKKSPRQNKRLKRELVMLTPPSDSVVSFDAIGKYELPNGIKGGVGHKAEVAKQPVDYPLTPDLLSLEELTETCTVCFNSDSPKSTLLCDGCSRAFHMKCLPIPLERIPKYDWFCDECLAGSTNGYTEYGFEEDFDSKFSLNEFRQYCKEWEDGLIKLIKDGAVPFQLSSEELENSKLNEETLERLFWDLTNGKISLPQSDDHDNSKLEIRYGADINSTVEGEISGFPSSGNPRRSESDNQYIDHEWNLINLPFAKGSLLEYICDSLSDGVDEDNRQISGMSVPWLYIGGPLSTFCWHKEDHYTLSANYSHLGSPKKWYGIPSRFSEQFEAIVNSIAPEYGAKQKDLMHQLVSMISPNEVTEKNFIPIYETIQRPGEFIITFPKVYHSGFNYGFNVNEAVNFTLPLWIPYSINAVEEYKQVGKECVFNTFELLKRIYFDLQTIEGKKRWVDETGVTEEEIDFITCWVNREYNKEVDRYKEFYQDVNICRVMQDLKRIGLDQYVAECKAIVRNSQGLKREGVEGGMDGVEEDSIKLEERVCMDCKTRVYFQWIVADLYEEYAGQETTGGAHGDSLRGLGIQYKDKESEWQAIIERAKRGDDGDGNEDSHPRRSSRRLKRKVSHGDEEEGVETTESSERERKKSGNGRDGNGRRLRKRERASFQGDDGKGARDSRRDILDSLKILRFENGFFGRYVFCIGCFMAELNHLDARERARVLRVCRVVDDV